MPRPSKKAAEEKAKMPIIAVPQPPPPPPQAMVVPAPAVPGMHPVAPGPVAPGVPQRVVDNDSFLRVRDSAVGRLTTILELLRSFTNDYIRQTNLLLGEHTAEGAQGDLINPFENAAQLMLPLPELAPLVEEKKERKKRTHDPHAPKRPLTPYFLYMQHARSIIANDLGAEAPKGAVQEEGQRRWAHMTPGEKHGWNNAYQYNLRLYNARVHSYKNGNPLAKNMSDEEALKYAEDYNVPMPELKEAAAQDAPVNDQAAIAEQLQQQVADAVSEDEEEETPAKTPKKPASGRKRKTATPAAAEVETPKPAAALASPEKKRRRASTKAADVEKEEPKKSGRKKTKSS